MSTSTAERPNVNVKALIQLDVHAAAVLTAALSVLMACLHLQEGKGIDALVATLDEGGATAFKHAYSLLVEQFLEEGKTDPESKVRALKKAVNLAAKMGMEIGSYAITAEAARQGIIPEEIKKEIEEHDRRHAKVDPSKLN